MKKLKDAGLIHAHVCASVYHARKAEAAEVDIIIASGHEGGGHVAKDPVHSMVLLPAVVDAVDRPVLASDGFSDSRSLVAALALGAKGVQVGTRFISTEECEFHDNYKQSILKAQDRNSIVTLGYLGDIRFLKNPYILDRKKKREEGWPEEKFREDHAKKRGLAAGDGDMINGPIMSGEVAGRIQSIPTIKALIEEIVSKADQTLRALSAACLE